MTFSDKLNYLFELTHAEGKELAAEMNVTPPQISKMRKGVRGLPKSREYSRVLAMFFAVRCDSDTQRNALAQTIRISKIRDLNDNEALADIILDWLADEHSSDDYAVKRTDAFLQQFDSLFDKTGLSGGGNTESVFTTGASRFFAFYGGDGKRKATEMFFNTLLQRRKAYTINVLADESIAWITDDASFARLFQSEMMKLTEQGCTFCRISGPISDVDQAFESLNRWFPLYMTGKASSYYYKRLRDSLNRITLFVVPEVAVMFSFSVGAMPQRDGVTFFTTDERTVNSMATVFNNYFAMCEPMMKVYGADTLLSQLHECMLRYEDYSGSCIQRCDSLSFITLPWDVATSLGTDNGADERNEFLTAFAKRFKSFKANLERYPFVDIIRLADARAVINGTVPIPNAHVLGSKPCYYSISGYVQHLHSILYLLEHRENYNVILRHPEDSDPTVMCVKEGFCAVFGRDAYPYSMFEVSERYLVDAFAEYLRRLIPDEAVEKAARRKTASEIRALITELETLIRERFEQKKEISEDT